MAGSRSKLALTRDARADRPRATFRAVRSSAHGIHRGIAVRRPSLPCAPAGDPRPLSAMPGPSPWLTLVVLLLAALVARLLPVPSRRARRALEWVDARLAGPTTPIVIGVLTGLAIYYVWGSLARSAVVHDESAYLLQAELFARWRFTVPTPPLPRFFEQLYVNLVPAVFSKYPPGTSLLIAPGSAIGVPGLPIVVATALTGALVFALARRFSDAITGLLAWAVWCSSFPVLYFHAMYLSEVPTGLAWLVAWWGIARWRSTTRVWPLAATALALAYCGITRPLTAVALSLAVGATLWRLASRRTGAPRLRRRELTPFVLGAACAVLVVGIWSWRSTGSPFVTPLSLYTRTYVPFDKLGFGARDADAPAASLPWDQRVTDLAFYQEHRRHTVSSLPGTLVARARMIGRDMWYDWRAPLALLALLGLVAAPPALWIGLGALGLQLLLYLLYAHPAGWSLYYMEGLPVLAFATALGVVRLIELGARERAPLHARLAAGVLLLAALAFPAWTTLDQVRAQIVSDHSFYDSFRALLPAAPDSAIVFVRYAPTHNDGLSLVRNVPTLASERVWVVYDRGAENARLLALAPRRTPYLFDEASWTMRPLTRAADPNADGR